MCARLDVCLDLQTAGSLNVGDDGNVVDVDLWLGVEVHMAVNARVVEEIHLKVLHEVALGVPVWRGNANSTAGETKRIKPDTGPVNRIELYREGRLNFVMFHAQSWVKIVSRCVCVFA